MDTQKPLLKDEYGEDVDVHMYRSMIGSLMYLTSSRLDIMFAVCACTRYQVNPKVSHLHAVKRIFRYLKGQPKLGLWYPKDSPFDLVAYTDSDYARASLDRKSTTGDTHSMVAFLSKPAKSDGFKQIVDFLNAYSIRNALTINPTIYISCIEQFWSSIKAKTINGEVQLHVLVNGKKISITKASVRRDLQLEDKEVQLQALVDGKKIIITEASVRRDLQLEDAEGVDCLPNAIIFEELTLMGIYIASSHTKKIFANMRRQGKDFSRRKTPLFPTMMIQAQEEIGEGSAMPTDPHHTPIITQPSSSQPQRKQKSRRRPKEKDTKIPQSSIPSDPIHIADEAVTEEPTEEITSLKKKDQIKFDEEEALRLQAKFDEEDRLAREKAQQVEEANIAWDDIQAKVEADYQLAQ
ncbi:hypothetical protein Tco_1106956 [Tanacetum coccineum]